MPDTETRATYHHGSLREELIRRERRPHRGRGDRRGQPAPGRPRGRVSPGAPYHHFTDRPALLAAIAQRGYELLEHQLRQARQAAPTAVRALGDLVRTYVGFARHHPAYLHLMLRPELSQSPKHPGAPAGGEGAIQILTETVLDCQRDGTAPPGDPDALVAMVWALAIGIVTLWLDGPLEGRCVSSVPRPRG